MKAIGATPSRSRYPRETNKVSGGTHRCQSTLRWERKGGGTLSAMGKEPSLKDADAGGTKSRDKEKESTGPLKE